MTPPMQDVLLFFAIWLARSGWLEEMPLSSMPTTTSARPALTAWACGTSIIGMSHC
ncbi:hypothetical protein ACLQ22_15965 [Micromonospora sp. DT178]|uniref:hypothetical protein n=1 Tax=Micromonospora sp. DT178 TaxID=3393436 RepID=UPI003CE73A15